MKPIIIALAGPTASGKTDLAIDLAQRLNTEIISFDSRQFYHELNIGVARPTPEQLNLATHHFIACKSIHTPYSAASFATDARKKITDILQNKEYVILCGGTGLYLKAILEGLSQLPEISTEVRESVEKIWRMQGLEGLYRIIKQIDPEAIAQLDTQNPARMKRATELLLLAQNQSLKEIYSHQPDPIPFDWKIYHLNPDRQVLYSRIEQRTDTMIAHGLIDEVVQLLPMCDLPLLKTVGYTEIFDYLKGNLTLNDAVALIKQHTRNYAKRQVTWFKNKTQATFLHPQNAADFIFNDLSDQRSEY
jgi:tRNA dimethylallyltransferase